VSPEFVTAHCFFEFVLRYDLQQLVKLAAVFAVYPFVGHVVVVGAQVNPCAVLLTLFATACSVENVLMVTMQIILCSANEAFSFVTNN
jgi:hypothetical protein